MVSQAGGIELPVALPMMSGRMVIDLGAVSAIGEVALRWTAGVAPATTVSTSVDGRTYTPATSGAPRYVAVATEWRPGQARLVALTVQA